MQLEEAIGSRQDLVFVDSYEAVYVLMRMNRQGKREGAIFIRETVETPEGWMWSQPFSMWAKNQLLASPGRLLEMQVLSPALCLLIQNLCRWDPSPPFDPCMC